jgi:hypothetical protein
MKYALFVLVLLVLLVPGIAFAQPPPGCSWAGDPYIRYGWVCGDAGPCNCNIPGWNPPGTGAPCAAGHYYANGFDTVDAYAGLQLTMDVAPANHILDQVDTFCIRIFGYPAGWTFSGNPALGTPVELPGGYMWWQTIYINVPCNVVVGSYNRVIVQQNYLALDLACKDCGDNQIPNRRPCTSVDRCTNVMYREDTLFVHIIATPPAIAILQDTLSFVERGQTQAYIEFQICNQDECAPLTTHYYHISSKGHIGYPLYMNGSVDVPGGECKDVYGIVNAGLAPACTYDTLTMIAWAGSPEVYDTCVQVLHVITAPVSVPVFTAPVVAMLVLTLILAAAVFMRRRVAKRA